MRTNWLENDRVIGKIDSLVEKCSDQLNVEVVAIVLYGSKARGDRNSQNDYEFLIFVDNTTDTNKFIKFIETVRMELLKEKMLFVRVTGYTPEVFEDLLYNDRVLGTFLYMICKENIIIYDKYATFMSIKQRLIVSETKNEEEFLSQCVEFAKMLGSEKWERKWEKTLLQYRYMKKRRE